MQDGGALHGEHMILTLQRINLWDCRPLAVCFDRFSEVWVVHLIQYIHLQNTRSSEHLARLQGLSGKADGR